MCSNYLIFLGDGDHCDHSNAHTWPSTMSPDWKGPGWYRFMGAAGTRMSQEFPGFSRAGTYAPGWLSQEPPSIPGEQKGITVCFDPYEQCHISSVVVDVLNCGEYLMYKLPDTRNCALKYSGTS